MRADLAIIADLINPGARVLDLGCGEGDLLAHLQKTKQVNGYGLEIDSNNITTCIDKGVNVIEQNLDQGLDNFASDSFDMVIMTETLQSVKSPDLMLTDMLRIGEECIVTFPNFGYWRCRLYFILRGKMPVAEHLPYSWYDTPNIHLCTFRDFERLCRDKGVRIIERFVADSKHLNRPLMNLFPNFFGAIAFYRLGSGGG
ncbi:MAG: methionine biosynthesis protein MetW [Gammaproteobacteria bacterium]|nr:methionine biosynthesis protein MetW [Gammaproteobacteria bacterium]